MSPSAKTYAASESPHQKTPVGGRSNHELTPEPARPKTRRKKSEPALVRDFCPSAKYFGPSTADDFTSPAPELAGDAFDAGDLPNNKEVLKAAVPL